MRCGVLELAGMRPMSVEELKRYVGAFFDVQVTLK
jgi:hypothetical protein